MSDQTQRFGLTTCDLESYRLLKEGLDFKVQTEFDRTGFHGGVEDIQTEDGGRLFYRFTCSDELERRRLKAYLNSFRVNTY